MKFVKVKSSQGSLGKNIGCEKAPDLILDKDDEEVEVVSDDFVKTSENLEKAEGDFFVGGDHSITYGLFKGFMKNSNSDNVGLVIFDAHPDCVNDFRPPTHEDFVRVLVEEGIVQPENIFIIGLRNADKIEQEYMEGKSIHHWYQVDISDIDEVILKVKDFVKDFDKWYLSLDIDVIDPEWAPGTGYPEKGGFSLDDFLNVVKGIKDSKNLERIDLVEINPDKDIDGKTIEAGKKIVELFE